MNTKQPSLTENIKKKQFLGQISLPQECLIILSTFQIIMYWEFRADYWICLDIFHFFHDFGFCLCFPAFDIFCLSSLLHCALYTL